MIDSGNFVRFMRDMVERSSPESGLFEPREAKLARQKYVMRAGLLWIIQHALAVDSGLTNTQRMRVAHDLSSPEIESQPQRWADRFEEKSHECRAFTNLIVVYALAADACAVVRLAEPEGDNATATDGNGDVRLDEVAA